MTIQRFIVAMLAIAATVGMSGVVAAQSEPPTIGLVVQAGRSVRIALDQRVRVTRVGQVITGTLVDPIYAYDRIVVPVGTPVLGRVEKLESAPKTARTRAILAGDFTPIRNPVLQFDTLVLEDGQRVAMSAIAKDGIPNVKRQVAGGLRKGGILGRERENVGINPRDAGQEIKDAEGDAVSDGQDRSSSDDDGSTAAPDVKRRARDAVTDVKSKTNIAISEVKRVASHPVSEVKDRAQSAAADLKARASDTLSAIKQPGKMERLKDAFLNRLPYHLQFLSKGTVYRAQLLSSLDFGAATPSEPAVAGTVPAPDSILTARLVTALDSRKTPRGTIVEAAVTEPVFSSDHHLILPAGSTIKGEVTFATHARYFHRNGQLRFLFESVEIQNQPAATLLASLHSVDASTDDHLALDEEGGASITNSKTRFIAPALAVVALRASVGHDHHGRGFDDDADDVGATSSIATSGASGARSGGVGSRMLGGFLGFSVIGAALSQISRSVGLGFAFVGVGRTVYSSVIAKGREVSFPADTAIQVRLAPGPSPAR